MALKRIIPCLLLDGNSLVKTIKFKSPNYIGDPINAIKIFNEKEVDEIIVIDISASINKAPPNLKKIAELTSECFMPFSYGGGIKTLSDFGDLFALGVEKVILNSLAFTNPQIIKEAIKIYGSQSIVVSVDFKSNIFGKKKVYSYLGHRINKSILDFCIYLEKEIGVGEIMLTSVDREGTWQGYDFEIIKEIAQKLTIPLIANGGAGKNEDLIEILYKGNVNAAAIGSMTVYQKKGMGVLIKFPNRNDIIKDNQ